jgi:hypothetical protein
MQPQSAGRQPGLRDVDEGLTRTQGATQPFTAEGRVEVVVGTPKGAMKGATLPIAQGDSDCRHGTLGRAEEKVDPPHCEEGSTQGFNEGLGEAP